jgi:hypothetical protein
MGRTSSSRVGRVVVAAAVLASLLVGGGAAPPASAVAGPSVVISQVYPYGGGTYSNDYLELFNRGNQTQNLGGWSIQILVGSSWDVTPLPAADLAPGRYFLVRLGGSPASNLPAPDATSVAEVVGGGGTVLVAPTTTPFGVPCPTPPASADLVGWGLAPCAAGGTAVPVSSNQAAIRKLHGCRQTFVNANDFRGLAPAPRNSATTADPCRPDLRVTAMSDPPASRSRGQKFSVQETTANQGTIDSVASQTRFFLSADGVSNAVALSPARSIGALAAGATSSGKYQVTIPSTTPLGTYHLRACADATGANVEVSEVNNCRRAIPKITVIRALPDLVVTSLSEPPASRKRGGSFAVTDKVKNKGPVKVGASETWYRLSADKVLGPGDRRLIGGRAVPRLSAGASSRGTTRVSIPTTTELGSYFVLACADGGRVRTESNERNNCRATASRVKVVRA